jgi:hypothetical protein
VSAVRRLPIVFLAILGAFAFAAANVSADPNDPAWADQWGPRVTRAADLWSATTGDPRTVIAVVDTGLTPLPDLTHVIPGWDILGNDADTSDTFGHGTWVSSIIGAAENNGTGIAGYCGNCSLMPVRVAAGREGAVAPYITAGIRWAIDHGARIVNVSLASNQYDWNQAGVVEYAQQHGVLIVASAGNGGDTSYRYPAAYPGVLAVAGADEQDILYSWSTRGAWVNVAAPGCETVLDASAGPAYGCGSSFSPASVSGIAGLLYSLNPSLTVEQVIDAIKATAVPVAGIGGGRIDAWAAAHYLGLVPAVPPPPPAPPAPAPVTPTSSRQVLLTTGVVRRNAKVLLDVSAGRLAVQLTGPAAADCSLTFRVGGEVYVGLSAERNVRSLAATVPRGRYPVTLACRTARLKAYEVSATGMFPN